MTESLPVEPLVPLAALRSDRPAFFANGPFLVMRTDAALPPRCIKCNRPANAPVRKRLLWADTATEPAGGALRHFPIVSYFFAILSMVRWFSDLRTLQAPVVAIPLCRRHRFTSGLMTAAAVICLPAGVATFWMPLSDQLHIWLPVFGLFATAILWTRPRPVKAVHVGIGYVTLAGARSVFLNSLDPISPGVKEQRPVDDIVASNQALRKRMAAKRQA